jgi:hypothetical protein
VVAERAFTYDNGKFVIDELGRKAYVHDTTTYQMEERLLQFLPFFDAWRPLVARLERPASLSQSKQIGYHIKAMASGSAVRADGPFKEVQLPVRSAWAIDMEGAALARVLASYPQIRWLIVKGVCDYADGEKDDAYHEFAAQASAVYALCLIQTYITNERLPQLDRRPVQQSSPAVKANVSMPQQADEGAPRPLKLFYSYAEQDEKYLKELEKHLKMLQRQGMIEPWHKQMVEGGLEDTAAMQALNAADIILLLVSTDFVASDFIYDVELAQAMQRAKDGQARVIPIILRPGEDWRKTPFGTLQPLPKSGRPIVDGGNRDQAWADVAKDIRRVCETLQKSR